jgi:hypothetical protein
MENHGSQHATRFVIKKCLTKGKAQQSLILTHKIALDISGSIASVEVGATQEPFTPTPKIMPSNAEIYSSLNAIEHLICPISQTPYITNIQGLQLRKA